MAFEGTCSSVHNLVDVSCKQPLLGSVVTSPLWCYGPWAHVESLLEQNHMALAREGLSITSHWSHTSVSKQKAVWSDCCAYFILTFVIKSKLPRPKEKGNKRSGD